MDTKINDAHTVLVETYRAASTADAGGLSYKGLRIHALPGLHEFTYSVLQRHSVAGENVLDLAAGSGAMSRRLLDGGYRVTASDYVPENFRLHQEIPFFVADLNNDFAGGREGSFDIIFASEIIEHLENPRHFARQCHLLLKPGGRIILSTPNLNTPASLVQFMRNGTFQWFADADYQHDGHITPLSQWQLQKTFSESGFEFRWQGSFGAKTEWIRGSPRLRMLATLVDKLMPLDEHLKNQIFVAVLAKKTGSA